MIRLQVKSVLDECFVQGVSEGSWTGRGRGKYTVELPKHEGQGDFSSNISLVLAGIEKQNPRVIAEKIVAQYREVIRKNYAEPDVLPLL